ncbi:MAG: hypothetical protein ACI9LM_002742 [Alteromonadaceae bacterium]|jgi:hypothetical protein
MITTHSATIKVRKVIKKQSISNKDRHNFNKVHRG